MALTRSTVAKGAGAIAMRQISTNRLFYLDLNSKYELKKTVNEGDSPQGISSSGIAVDLASPSQELSFELEVASKKNTRNVNELIWNAVYVAKTGYQYPWAETATVASAAVTLKAGTPVAASLKVTIVDTATQLTVITSGSPASGEVKDNADGTLTFNAAQEGANIVCWYKLSANVSVQGGADYTAIGDLDVMFHYVSGESSVTNKKGVDVLWLPKCSLSGDISQLFSNDVEDKTFTLKPVVPTSPAGWTVPYQFIRDLELDNRNAG